MKTLLKRVSRANGSEDGPGLTHGNHQAHGETLMSRVDRELYSGQRGQSDRRRTGDGEEEGERSADGDAGEEGERVGGLAPSGRGAGEDGTDDEEDWRSARSNASFRD